MPVTAAPLSPECEPACAPVVVGRWAGAVTLRRGLVGFVAFLLAGNVAIAGVSAWARRTTPPAAAPHVSGIKNFRVVDGRLWRGAAPSPNGYRSLAAAGVRTVVDLRAEPGLHVDEDL